MTDEAGRLALIEGTLRRVETTNKAGITIYTTHLRWLLDRLAEAQRERDAWVAATGDPSPEHAEATTADLAASIEMLASQRDKTEADRARLRTLADEAEQWMNAHAPALDLDERDRHRALVSGLRAVLDAQAVSA